MNDREHPAIELPHAFVKLARDAVAIGDRQEGTQLFEDHTFSDITATRHDFIAHVIGNEEGGHRTQVLGGFGNVTEFKVGDPSTQIDVVHAVEQATVIAVAAPGFQQLRELARIVSVSSVGIHA